MGLEKIQGIEFSDKYELAIRLYSKIKNYENKISVVTNEKTILISGSKQETKIQDDVSTHSAQWHLDKAKDFEDLGQYDRALKHYEKAIEKDPYNFLSICNKAILLERIERFTEALEAIEQAIDIEPKNTYVWYHKASILEKLQKYDEALKALEIDLNLDPKDVKSWASKAKLLEQIERYDDAIECFANILRIDPINNDVLNKRKIIQEQLDKRKAEQNETIQETKINEDVKTLHSKGLALYNQGKYQEAIDYFDKVLKLEPNNESSRYNRFLALETLTKEKPSSYYSNTTSKGTMPKGWTSSHSSYSNTSLNYEDLGTLMDKGNALCDKGKYKEAIEWFDKALREDFTYARALNGKGFALGQLGKHKEAIEWYDKALRVNPTFVEALNGKGFSIGELGKHKEAIEWYDKALTVNPKYVNALNNKGYALYELGKQKEAIEWLDKALEIDPNNTTFKNNRKFVLESLSKNKSSFYSDTTSKGTMPKGWKS